jgi:hypothetical protein
MNGDYLIQTIRKFGVVGSRKVEISKPHCI